VKDKFGKAVFSSNCAKAEMLPHNKRTRIRIMVFIGNLSYEDEKS